MMIHYGQCWHMQKEEYIKLYNRRSELTDLLEREAFTEGLSLAVKIMINVVDDGYPADR